MSLQVLLTSFGLIFMAELGDKTQLTAMALAARFSWKQVFLGIAAAFLVLNALAVLVGQVLWTFLPPFWVQVGAGVLFLFFGVTSLLAKPDDDCDEDAKQTGRRPVVTAFLMILVAELGDKTQLATAGLAAETRDPLAVFLGSTLALWLVSLLGILVGKQLSQRVPPAFLHRAAGVLFLLFGGFALYRALA